MKSIYKNWFITKEKSKYIAIFNFNIQIKANTKHELLKKIDKINLKKRV